MRFSRTRQDLHIGLDLSPGRIKIIGLEGGHDSPSVVFAADEAVASGVGRARFDPTTTGAEIAAVLARFRVRPRRVSLALGPAEAVARRLVVVDQEHEQMVAALTIQLSQALGSEVTAPRVAYTRLDTATAAGRVAVLAAAAHADAVGAQQRAVQVAGCERGLVTPAAAAVIRAWRACQPAASSDLAVLLHVGESAALWIVMDGGEPVALDAPLVGAAAFRERGGVRTGGSVIPPAVLAEWAGRLRQEVSRGVQPLQREAAPGDRSGECPIWISGGALAIPGFHDALENALPGPVHVLDPLGGTNTSGVFGPALAAAFGAALGGMDSADLSEVATGNVMLDLRAPESSRAAGGRIPAAGVLRAIASDRAYHAAVVAGVLLCGAGAVIGNGQAARERALAKREAQVVLDSASVARALVQTRQVEDRQQALGARLEGAAGLEQGRLVWPQLLSGISRAIPGPAWVTDVVSDGEDPASGVIRFSVHGFASSDAVAGNFAAALVASGTAAEARVGRTAMVRFGRTRAVRFVVVGQSPSGTSERGEP
jgi:Tfp pilus assembly PilM family ATPase/Tfp pilus assembly protein PilN